MKTLRTSLAIGLLLAPAVSMALPPFLQQFKATYPPKSGTALANASCTTCHLANSTERNAYGKDVEKTFRQMKLRGVTAAVLKAVESLDSDKDGVKNGDEIAKGTLPGDPKSK